MHNATKDAIDFVREQISQRKSVSRDDLIQAAVVSGFKHKTSALFTAVDYLILSGEIGRTKRGTYELVEQPEPEEVQEPVMSEARVQVIEAYKATIQAFTETSRILASIDQRMGMLEKHIGMVEQSIHAICKQGIEIDAANRRLASIEARTASTHQMVSQMHQQAEAKAIAGIERKATGSDAIGGTD
jgi:hypothetical protein